MDNQDVCLRLDISPRTLQTLRDTGRLAFTQIQRKNLLQAGGRRKADGLCRHETQGKGGERKKKE